MIASGTQEWRRWVQGAAGPVWDLEKGEAWQQNVLASLGSPVQLAHAAAPCVPVLSQPAQIKNVLVNSPRKTRSETLPFLDKAPKILSEPPLVLLENKGRGVGFNTGQRLESVLDVGVASPQQCKASPGYATSRWGDFSFTPAALEGDGLCETQELLLWT